MLNYFPKYFTNKAIIVYVAASVVVFILFVSYSMQWFMYVFGLVSVIAFFYFSNNLTKKWVKLTEKAFERKLFVTALTIRVIYVLFAYLFYKGMTGIPFEFGAADALGYDQSGREVAEALRNGNWTIFKVYADILGVSDSGYISYIGVLYWLTGDSIFADRLLKALYGALTVLFAYRLAGRNFGESTGRIAGILCMLTPNLIWYCGSGLKECVMVFLIMACIERADYAMRSPKLSFRNMSLPVFLMLLLFTFRTVLGMSALMAFFTALVMSRGTVMRKTGRRVMLIVWTIALVAFFAGGRIAMEVEQIWEGKDVNQKNSMEWRAKGNSYVEKYAGAAVFAPLIFTIPFPTAVDVGQQYNQQTLNGGNYIKNIMSFFVIFSLLLMLRTGKWRDFTLIVAFTVGYLLIIALSAFAHSERFHQPAQGFEMILAAYGISMLTNKTKPYYIWWLVFMAIVFVVWNFVKLDGRGFL